MFIRDRSSTGAALLVMTIVLMLVSGWFMLEGVSEFFLKNLQDRIDISTYFKDSATEAQILQLKDELAKFPEVKEVDYISKEDALNKFVATHKEDQLILRSLDALGDNPLLASLSIKAWAPESFEKISTFLEASSFAPVIENVDYRDRAPVIERIAKFMANIRNGILVVSMGGSIVVFLVLFNTIRLAISHSKEEIEVMRLVGASNLFIGGPFIVQGILVGLIAMFILFLLSFLSLPFIAPRLEAALGGFNFFSYFTDHLFLILGLQAAVGIGLGILSSFLAIRKYLRA